MNTAPTPRQLISAAFGLRRTAHHHWNEAREYQAMGRDDRAASHRKDAARCIETARFNLRWARSQMNRAAHAEPAERNAA